MSLFGAEYLVSAVIPTHNRAHLVVDALDSVAAQDLLPIEIIVVDDASNDNTKDVVSAWSDQHPDIPLRYILQDRAGGNAARNRGLTEARGEYVAFLDSDDVWHAEKIARQVDRLTTRPGYGAVYTGLREVDAETGAVLFEPSPSNLEGDLLDALLVKDVTGPTSTYLVNRQLLIDVGGFDPSLEARQDWDMSIRLAERTKIACVAEALVDLRHHSGPRTATDPTRELRAYERILEKYSDLRSTRRLRVRMAALASFHRRVGRVQFHYLGNRSGALRSYLVGVMIWPFEPDSWAALIGLFLPNNARRALRHRWNRVFGRTFLAIRNH